MCNSLRIMKVVFSSAVDGEGFRDTVYVNYCPHHCEGCHNPQTWDKENGIEVSIDEVLSDLTKSRITNVTYSGGEPFCQAEALAELTRRLKARTDKTVWVYSGYTFEEIIADPKKKELLSLCEVLVDGRFVLSKKEENLRFKGSTNQRIIDIQKSLSQKQVVLWQDGI